MNRIGAFATSILVGLACQGKIDEGFDEVRLRESCSAWCETILACSTYYKEQDQVSTQSECEDTCQEYVTVWANHNGSCFDLILDERECTAPLTCDEFQNYENYAFAQSYDFPVQCRDEFKAMHGPCG